MGCVRIGGALFDNHTNKAFETHAKLEALGSPNRSDDPMPGKCSGMPSKENYSRSKSHSCRFIQCFYSGGLQTTPPAARADFRRSGGLPTKIRNAGGRFLCHHRESYSHLLLQLNWDRNTEKHRQKPHQRALEFESTIV